MSKISLNKIMSLWQVDDKKLLEKSFHGTNQNHGPIKNKGKTFSSLWFAPIDTMGYVW